MFKSIVEDNEDSTAFRIFLSILYVPFSFICILMSGFLWDAPIESVLDRIGRTIFTYILLAMPLISIISIIFSVILRKRNRKKLSFYIQFSPIAIIVLPLLLLYIISKIAYMFFIF